MKSVTDNGVRDFSFDTDGRFVFTQVYLLGVLRQLDRYQASYREHGGDKGVGLGGLMDLMHELSCLLESLDCLAIYMENGDFVHPKHKLWKQARHHIRHDLRDINTSEADRGKTRTRLKYLKTPKGLFSSLQFKADFVEIGGHRIIFDEVKEYVDWADDIFGDYIEWSRATGHMRPAEKPTES